jgi:glucosamine 6-phosphate synthetase-like amidotransferase/phosphosugar isomerase protein
MCGVIGLTSRDHRKDLGLVAAELLKTLEYRGYDSTGAAFQGDDDAIVLRKGVGAPSVMVEKLGIVGLEGSIMCGQVRWATFGSVDEVNAQPHEVRCKTHIYGAHNGNVTNCDDLKAWLTSEGHQVLSDTTAKWSCTPSSITSPASCCATRRSRTIISTGASACARRSSWPDRD